MILIRCHLDERRATRYEVGGERARPTHAYIHPERVDGFSWDWVQMFRTDPPEEYRLDPGPKPTNPPAGAGTIQRAA